MSLVDGAGAEGEGGKPPEGEGGTPPEGEGGTPPEGEGGTPPEGEGGTPPEGEGGTPPEGEGGKPPEGEGGKPPEGEGEAATLEDINLPEGFEMSEEAFSGLSEAFKNADVPFTKKLAQELVEWETSHQQAQQQAYNEAAEARSNEWKEASKADKEFGGDKFDESLVAAQEVFTKLATPELRELVDQSGLGDHPEFIRLFLKIAPSLREERPGTQTGAPGKRDNSLLDRLYGGGN